MNPMRLVCAVTLTGCLAVGAQQPSPSAGAQPQTTQAQREQMKRRTGPPQPAPKDDPSFKAIFDGKSLNGWEGDAQFWRVADGAIVGETTAANPLKQNTFLTWRAASPKDFEVKAEYRISAVGNSGVQYRSEDIPDRKHALRGYQADIDAENRYTGQIYEEGGRGFMALRGQTGYVDANDPPNKMGIGSLGDGAQLAGLIRKQDWNEIHIIARGNTLIQMINGQVMSILIDDDPKGRRMEGVIGLQLHVGPPMKIEYRNIRLKRY